MNACCGHGDPDAAYIQFSPTASIDGLAAFELMQALKTADPGEAGRASSVLRFIFAQRGDGPALEFVEVEDQNRRAVSVGEWSVDADGMHVLTIRGPTEPFTMATIRAAVETLKANEAARGKCSECGCATIIVGEGVPIDSPCTRCRGSSIVGAIVADPPTWEPTGGVTSVVGKTT